MTPLEREATFYLGRCRFLPGTSAKRFSRALAAKEDSYELSDKQRAFMWFLVYRFRRQIPNKEVIKMAELIKGAAVQNGNQR